MGGQTPSQPGRGAARRASTLRSAGVLCLTIIALAVVASAADYREYDGFSAPYELWDKVRYVPVVGLLLLAGPAYRHASGQVARLRTIFVIMLLPPAALLAVAGLLMAAEGRPWYGLWAWWFHTPSLAERLRGVMSPLPYVFAFAGLTTLAAGVDRQIRQRHRPRERFVARLIGWAALIVVFTTVVGFALLVIGWST